MIARFILLLSAGIIVACIAAFIWGIIGPMVPAEHMWKVIWGIIIVLAVIAAIILNR